jgi:hypothetical protein
MIFIEFQQADIFKNNGILTIFLIHWQIFIMKA